MKFSGLKKRSDGMGRGIRQIMPELQRECFAAHVQKSGK